MQISLVFKLVMQIWHVDQKKATWFERDFCVSSASCIATQHLFLQEKCKEISLCYWYKKKANSKGQKQGWKWSFKAKLWLFETLANLTKLEKNINKNKSRIRCQISDIILSRKSERNTRDSCCMTHVSSTSQEEFLCGKLCL